VVWIRTSIFGEMGINIRRRNSNICWSHVRHRRFIDALYIHHWPRLAIAPCEMERPLANQLVTRRVPHAAKWVFRHHFFRLHLLKSEINKTLTILMGTSASANPTVMLRAVLCRSAAAVVGSCFRMFWRKWEYHCTRCIALSAESGSIR
jgi:hypothetical protein